MTEETKTLREQAREAIEGQGEWTEDGGFLIGPDSAADAASDVWEEECERLRKENERFSEFVQWYVNKFGMHRATIDGFLDVLERAGVR